MSDQPTHVTPPPPPPPPPAPAVPAAKKRSLAKRVATGVGAAALILAAKFGLGYVMSDHPVADSVSVGSCVKDKEAGKADGGIVEVPCTDASAQFKVLHIAKDKPEAEADSVCAAFPDADQIYFESLEGETKGNVICLAPAK